MKNKRVLSIAATPYFADRGGHIRIYTVTKYLEKNGFKVRLCTYHLGENPQGFDSSAIKRTINMPWYKKTTPGASFHKLYINFFLTFLAIKEYIKYRPAFIHAHMFEGVVIAGFIKVLTFGRANIIMDCQGSLTQEMIAYTLHKKKYYKLFVPIFVLIEKLALMIPNKIYCTSENSYTYLKTKFKIRDSRIEVLNDGVDMDMFFPFEEIKKVEIKKSLNIPEGNKVIVYTGSLAKAKGVDALLEKVPTLLELMPNVTLGFFGFGKLEETYREKYAEYIKQGKVIIYGKVPYFELNNFLQIGDYAIDPKKDTSESSGKLYNYAAAGLPVICFKNDLNYNFLKENGLYIEKIEDIKDVITGAKKTETPVIPDEFKWDNLVKNLTNYLFTYSK
ncbi:MAG: glycosyltransferase [bacterium]